MSAFCHSVVMIAGDSGDGIQLIGQQLTYAHAQFGHVVQTIAEFPAEIRAPVGTIHGVSGFRLAFSSRNLAIVPFELNYAVVFNPAAYLSLGARCTANTIVIFDEERWNKKDYRKAGCTDNPLDSHQGLSIPIALTSLTCAACPMLTPVQAKKNRNILALGLMLWLHDLSIEPALEWLSQNFSKNLEHADCLIACLKAGYYLGETLELPVRKPSIPVALRPMGRYAQITGDRSLVLGMLSASEKYQRPVILSGYPITPASEILQIAHQWADCGLEVVQAEDEIAAAGIALGASYGGALGVTCTSGPGLDLKAEMMGLAVMAELPMVIINVQRCGPSTGLPTKTEQSDLLAALYGRHGSCPVPVLAQSSPADGQHIMERAFEWAISAMTPVIVLSDGFLTQGSAALFLDNLLTAEELSTTIEHSVPEKPRGPFERDSKGVRPWIVPGTPHQAHCNGGLEKDYDHGGISYDGANHERMIQVRRDKVETLASPMAEPQYRPLVQRYLWIGYGSTSGGLEEYHYQNPSQDSTYIILRDIYPLPSNFWDLCQQYQYVITVELSDGQLARYLRGFAKHAHILSYSQTNASALDLVLVKQWFQTLTQEDSPL